MRTVNRPIGHRGAIANCRNWQESKGPSCVLPNMGDIWAKIATVEQGVLLPPPTTGVSEAVSLARGLARTAAQSFNRHGGPGELRVRRGGCSGGGRPGPRRALCHARAHDVPRAGPRVARARRGVAGTFDKNPHSCMQTSTWPYRRVHRCLLVWHLG